MSRQRINGWYGTCSECGGECISGVGSWWHTGKPCARWRVSRFIVDPPEQQPPGTPIPSRYQFA